MLIVLINKRHDVFMRVIKQPQKFFRKYPILDLTAKVLSLEYFVLYVYSIVIILPLFNVFVIHELFCNHLPMLLLRKCNSNKLL